jgi:hypothetical protein
MAAEQQQQQQQQQQWLQRGAALHFCAEGLSLR